MQTMSPQALHGIMLVEFKSERVPRDEIHFIIHVQHTYDSAINASTGTYIGTASLSTGSCADQISTMQPLIHPEGLDCSLQQLQAKQMDSHLHIMELY